MDTCHPRLFQNLNVYLLHIYMIFLYAKPIRKQHPGGTIVFKGVRLAYIMIINPETIWFEIIQVP